MIGHSIHQSLYRLPNKRYDQFQIKTGSSTHSNSDVTKRRCNVSSDVLDAAAQKLLTGGYTNKRNPICPDCNIRKSNSGICSC